MRFNEVEFRGQKAKAFDFFLSHRLFMERSKPDKSKIVPLRKRWNLEIQRTPQFEGGSNVHIPVMRWMVEALAVRLYTAHFYNQPYVLLRPNNIRVAEAVDDLETLLFRYQAASNRNEAFYPIIMDGVLLGTGVGYKYWKTTKDKSYPCTEYVPLEHLIVYPAVVNIDDAIAFGHSAMWSVRRVVEEFPNVDEEVLKRAWGLGAETEAPSPELTFGAGWGLVEVFFVHFWFEGKIYEVVYADGYLLRFREYPLTVFPYVLYAVNRRYGLFGEGSGRQLSALEDEIIDLHNLKLDNLKLTNMPIFKVRKGSSASNIRTFSFGEKVITETPNDIEPLFMPTAFPSLDGAENMLMEYAKLVSGVSEIMAGSAGKPYTTAYAIETSILEGSVKFKQIFNGAKNALVRDAHIDLQMIKLFGEDAFQTLLIGKPNPMIHFTKDAIVDLTDFSIEPNTSTINRETDRQRLLMLRELMGAELTEAGRYQLNAAILRNFGFLDVETFLGEPPQELPPPEPTMAMGGGMGMGMAVPPMTPPEVLPPPSLGGMAGDMGGGMNV